MLEQTDITILKMLYSGSGHQEIALSFEYTLGDYYNAYIELLTKTTCWDETELCDWWLRHKQLYLNG